MKRLVLSLAVAGLLAQVAVAQEPTPAEPPMTAPPALTVEQAPQQTETWLREQQRRDAADPALAVRKNAAVRGSQRRERMGARKWYGHSMGRPVANTTPFTGTYAPDILLLDVGAYESPVAPSPAPSTASLLRPLIR